MKKRPLKILVPELQFSKGIHVTWNDLVTKTLFDLGGRASLKQINAAIAGHIKCKSNPTWQATIRRTVRHSKNIVPVRPKEHTGIYRLITYVEPKDKTR